MLVLAANALQSRLKGAFNKVTYTCSRQHLSIQGPTATTCSRSLRSDVFAKHGLSSNSTLGITRPL